MTKDGQVKPSTDSATPCKATTIRWADWGAYLICQHGHSLDSFHNGEGGYLLQVRLDFWRGRIYGTSN